MELFADNYLSLARTERDYKLGTGQNSQAMDPLFGFD